MFTEGIWDSDSSEKKSLSCMSPFLLPPPLSLTVAMSTCRQCRRRLCGNCVVVTAAKRVVVVVIAGKMMQLSKVSLVIMGNESYNQREREVAKGGAGWRG